MDCVLSEWHYFDSYVLYLSTMQGTSQDPSDILDLTRYQGSCTAPCAGGVRQRFRFVLQRPSRDGYPCGALYEYVACNIEPCTSTRETTRETTTRTESTTPRRTTEQPDTTTTTAGPGTTQPSSSGGSSDTAMVWLVVILIVCFLASTVGGIYALAAGGGMAPVGAVGGDVETTQATFMPFTDLYNTDSYYSGRIRDNPQYGAPEYVPDSPETSRRNRVGAHHHRQEVYEEDDWETDASSLSMADEEPFNESGTIRTFHQRGPDQIQYWVAPTDSTV